MNIQFSQIYAEVDTSYDITNTVLTPLRHYLVMLNKNIMHYNKLFNADDYSIVFIISATRNDKELVKGPTTLSKKKKVEFVIFIPYKELKTFAEQMSYVLDYIAEGIIFVFNKYKTDPSGVKEAVEEVKKMIMDDPDKYQKWTK
ncbi:Uncharacterised protein [Yersinia pseudotuberculosis]|uniref:Uncharacterized protein n=3 Tax=Yersinia pseudotuberculosis complex TaxID=1649845 RepID=A0A0T9RPX7_9GAMM|nr:MULTISPECIES: hypothetical protein [Yersinia pseudotuberculosis complex]CNC63846.1 Uncharacterised protein [Yersinia similis]CNG64561.1 Uncharacterised protein [Yersinia similis]CNI76344.1 Uncharacterised protein [Yersinia similis]CNL69864.1 Uncharacterised protein [Yersinia pseudotuberculosis]CRG52610.1 Uncharacterised protein [Yersinia wautersii]